MPKEVQPSPDDAPEDSDVQEPEMTQEELARIFEERFDLFMSQLSERVEEENVHTAFAVLVDPKYPQTPMVFKTGHVYDLAKLLANALRILRKQIDDEISP